MSRPGFHQGRQRRGFPRVSGDEPMKAYRFQDKNRFSPRERG